MKLKMPNKYERLTIKIIKSPYVSGDSVFCDVRIWGDVVHSRIFKMEIGKSLWRSLHKALVHRFEFGGDIGEEIDKNLECLLGKVITIRGIPDFNRSFNTKSGGSDSPKVFEVTLREDLEELEKVGSEEYTKKAKEELSICALYNLEIIDESTRKRVEWVEKRKKREDKAERELKKLNVSGW